MLSSVIYLYGCDCAMGLPIHPCPSVLMFCSVGQRKQIPLPGGRRSLQKVQRSASAAERERGSAKHQA